MSLAENDCGVVSYDLLSQPCLPVLTTGELRRDDDIARDSHVERGRSGPSLAWRSLREVFASADEDALAITHPSPGTEIACYELLLAVCHAAGFTPRSPDEWSEWVDDERPLDDVVDWLSSSDSAGRFDLFDPIRPFGQNPLLAGVLGTCGYSPVQLMLERAKNYNQFADHVHLCDPEPVSARDAFLAMVTQHCYGLGGRVKTEGVVKELASTVGYGDSFTRGAVGRLGTRVRVLAVGETLGDTLRLNLSIGPSGGTFNATWSDRPRRLFKSLREVRTLDGPADWHSTVGRGVLLRGVPAGEGGPVVDRVLLGMGETVTAEHDSDGYTAYDTVFVKGKPLQASVDRALWRDVHAIYSASLAPGRGDGLFNLLGSELRRPVRLLVVGLDAKNNDVRGWVRDTFPFDPEPDRKSAMKLVSEVGVQITEDAVKALKDAASAAFVHAYPSCPPKQRKNLMERFDATTYLWARADASFHRALEGAAVGHDPQSELHSHADAIRAIAIDALDEKLRSLTPNAQGWQARVRARDKLQSGLRARSFKEWGSR
ncbi:type I-E CRISPR-associated protein Cse1/CasA [Nocardia sp. NPDC055321]